MPQSSGTSADLCTPDATAVSRRPGDITSEPDQAQLVEHGAIRRWQASFRDREVIARPLGFFFREFERLGESPDALLNDISLSRDQLTNRHGRIDWETLRIFMRNIGRVWSDDDLVAAGQRMVSSPWIRPFGLIARLLYSVDELYRWNFRPMTGGSAQFFTCIENAMTEHGPGRISVETWMAPGYRPARELFLMFRGSLTDMPRMAGLRPATVELTERADGSVRYDIEYPAGGGMLAGLRRVLTRPFIARSIARELEAATELLFERYAELAHQTRERAQATAALRESDERFRTAFDSAPTLMILSSYDGRIVDINESFVAVTGYRRDELIGHNTRQFNFWKPPETRTRIIEDLQAGRPVRGVEVEFVRRNGEAWTGLLSAESTAVDGERCIIWSAVDITARKKAEEENRLLAERIVQSQKLESLGVMAGGIAHDFNNLLVGILGNAELTLSDVDAGIQPSRERVEAIQVASQRAADLTQEMLAYAGKARQVSEPVELNALVAETATLLRSSLPKHVRLDYPLRAEPAWVEGDPAQIRRVVMNLMTNAAESFGEASGRVNVRTSIVDADRQMLDDSYLDNDLPSGRYAVVRVTDAGCGMDADTLKRIFEPFFTTKFTGRGLGLAATLGIIRGHGGTLRVRSSKSSGTAFEVFLPVTDQRPQQQDQETPATAASGTILVIDDEAMVREVAQVMLRQLGYETLGAESGQRGLAMLAEHADSIVAVVLDLTMPGMSGDETFEALRERAPDLPVLCCTGHGLQAGVSWLEGKRRVGFISKPFRLHELGESLSILIGE